MHVLVAGGAGYIGSHTAVALLEKGIRVTIVDNFINSCEEACKRVATLTGHEAAYFRADLCDSAALEEVFSSHSFDAVIHFAGLKAVGESVAMPLRYYENNLISTLNLLRTMERHAVHHLVFSSSATVYGNPEKLPLGLDHRLQPLNPYGRTKYFIEEILRDAAHANNKLHVSILRYFNPVGAHESYQIGEDPLGIPQNLMPFITKVAVGERRELTIFGNDYDTADGTCIRDYIHVVDLALGHIAALRFLNRSGPGAFVHNLGTGRGYSVLEVVRAFEEANSLKIPYRIGPRRAGDAAVCYSDPSVSQTDLDWRATRDLKAMCEDSWGWQKRNPRGYRA